MSQIIEENVPYVNLNSLNVYKVDENYLITVYENGAYQEIALFFPDRTCKTIKNLKLIQDEEISQYIGMNINQIKEKYGQPHADIGSGFYIPAYIAENGYIICFKINDNIIFEVIKRDIMTNEIIDVVN